MKQECGQPIEEHHRCFGLGGYFMAAVLAAASYSRIGFSTCLAVRARRVRVPGGSAFHLEPVTIDDFNSIWQILLAFGLEDDGVDNAKEPI